VSWGAEGIDGYNDVDSRWDSALKGRETDDERSRFSDLVLSLKAEPRWRVRSCSEA
jgi:hypothetical protein